MSFAQYTYEAVWSEEEHAYVARVREFPGLEARAGSRGGALRALKGVVYAVAKELADSGGGTPEPAEAKRGAQG